MPSNPFHLRSSVLSLLAGRVSLLPKLGWLLLLSGGVFVGPLPAQDLRRQSHPLSTYLDLRAATPDAPAQTTPAWVEALEFMPAADAARHAEQPAVRDDQQPPRSRSVFRVRLQRPAASTSEQLQARVFFEDLAAGARPQVTLWNELGEKLAAVSLGQNLGLPSSETLTLPMHGVDYLEIEAEGDGSQVRGVFLSWLGSAEVLQPEDFPSSEPVRQPFQILSATRKQKDDSYLYGVVTASLQAGKPVVLKPADAPSLSLQFQIERRPLVAVITYEVLGAAINAPPNVTINGHPQGLSSLHLPDLADPGFRGEAREANPELTFRYTGWLHAQKIIPGELLAAGLNNLSLGLSDGTSAVAIRSVAIQLKYDWEKLDCVLTPAPVVDETP